MSVPPPEFVCTRAEYERWRERGMIPRDLALLWVSAVDAFVLVAKPPRRIPDPDDAAPSTAATEDTAITP